MNKEEFFTRFKEQLNIQYQHGESKYNRENQSYWEGFLDGIDISEGIFDKLWKEYNDKN